MDWKLAQEINKVLDIIVNNFSKEYPEWADEIIQVGAIDEGENPFLVVENTKYMNELLGDIRTELKRNGLMIAPNYRFRGYEVNLYIEEDIILAEVGAEDIADELDAKIGDKVSNLTVTFGKGDKPYVRFAYLGNPTSEDKKLIRMKVEETVNSYEAVDEESALQSIEHDDLDMIMKKINREER